MTRRLGCVSRSVSGYNPNGFFEYDQLDEFYDLKPYSILCETENFDGCFDTVRTALPSGFTWCCGFAPAGFDLDIGFLW